MAEFLQHEPCPRCGSRDNLGRYSDGTAWCFGCHHFIGLSDSRDLYRASSTETRETLDELHLPPDACFDYPRHVVEWLARYDVSVPEAMRHGWTYSPYYDQLIFGFDDGEGRLAVTQARNFRSPIKRKYFNQGSPADVLPIFRAGKGPDGGGTLKTLVVVEDVVSAARIARQCDAMPLLGSYLPLRKIVALKALYESLVVWLDQDKLKEAWEIADFGRWLGMRTRTIYTDLDPKEYSDAEIQDFIRGSLAS